MTSIPSFSPGQAVVSQSTGWKAGLGGLPCSGAVGMNSRTRSGPSLIGRDRLGWWRRAVAGWINPWVGSIHPSIHPCQIGSWPSTTRLRPWGLARASPAASPVRRQEARILGHGMVQARAMVADAYRIPWVKTKQPSRARRAAPLLSLFVANTSIVSSPDTSHRLGPIATSPSRGFLGAVGGDLDLRTAIVPLVGPSRHWRRAARK